MRQLFRDGDRIASRVLDTAPENGIADYGTVRGTPGQVITWPAPCTACVRANWSERNR
jgi:hypothetical protein